jgi:hypothetical protein
MRYWGYFAAKLAVAGSALYGALLGINSIWPVEQNPPALAPLRDGPELLLYNLLIMGWVLACAGALFLAVADQRRRCRTCLRRLRMPVLTGSWGRLLLSGHPHTEYICPYGHGTLEEDELRITGAPPGKWTARSGDLWKELCASSKESNQKP